MFHPEPEVLYSQEPPGDVTVCVLDPGHLLKLTADNIVLQLPTLWPGLLIPWLHTGTGLM